MSAKFKDFLLASEWDAPFFKRLARNDTGRAQGHQGGMVVPKNLRDYFPVLDLTRTSDANPTVDRFLSVELFVGSDFVENSRVRYQFQTWHGSRSPESRLTSGFTSIRSRADAGDVMIFQRRIDSFDHFRFLLVSRGGQEFAEISSNLADRKSGPLFVSLPPLSQGMLSEAESEILDMAHRDFVILRQYPQRLDVKGSRLARLAVFPERLRIEYDGACCISGFSLRSPDGYHEVEAAHVVPLSRGGVDDLRNGLVLTRTLHWAFDRGLFGITQERCVYVPRRVRALSENAFLCQFEGRKIMEARNPELRVHSEALRWHMENCVKSWD